MPTLRNPKHEAFCREVAGGVSAERAWASAGNNPAANNVGRLMKQASIQIRIAELRAEFNQQSGLHLRYLQEKLLPIATSDVTAYFETDADGRMRLRDVTKLPPEIRSALSEIKVDEDGNTTVKTWNKNDALNALMKSIGGFPATRVEITEATPAADAEDMNVRDTVRRLVFSINLALRDQRIAGEDRRRLISGVLSTIDGGSAPDELRSAAELPSAFVDRAGSALARCCQRVMADGDVDAARKFIRMLRELADAVQSKTGANVDPVFLEGQVR